MTFNEQLVGFSVIIFIFIALRILSKINEGFDDTYPLTNPTKKKITTTGSVVQKTINMKVNWRSEPSQQLSVMIREFGLPDLIDVNQGGLALWKQTTLAQRGFCWDQVILQDVPSYFVRISYSFPLIQLRGRLELTKALDDITDFHPAVLFDQTNQSINAKANSPQQAVVLLVLSKRLLSKELTLQQVRNLLNSMLTSVESKSQNYDPNAYSKFKIELCSVGLPLANSLGETPPGEIFTLRPGAPPKQIRNMDILNLYL
jgi:hypothetical protein